MKKNYLNQLIKFTVTAFASAIIITSPSNPTPPLPGGNGGDGQTIEEPDNKDGNGQEPGISPMNDKDTGEKDYEY